MNRKLWTLLSALGAVLCLFGAAALVAQRAARLRGALDGLPGPDLPPRVPVAGVNVDLTQYDPAELEENLDLIADTGFAWVRQPFRWGAVEPEPGEYDWAALDRAVEAASARGLRVAAVLRDSPGWAADHPTAPPADLTAFTDFAAAVAARYGDRVDVYQIWDEPNLAAGWGDAPPSPVGYAALLEAAYGPIHAADPDALVLAAGLAPTVETGPDNLNDVLYLRALYDNGAAPFFDGAAGKPYGFDAPPGDRRAHLNRLNFSRFVLLREEMVRHGDADKPLWASHFGWNALPAGWDGDPSAWGAASPAEQAMWTVGAYERALTEWPWAGALILENWQPAAPADDPRWGFALRGPDGSLSPTAAAVRARSDAWADALWPGFYPPTDPRLAYEGEWKFSELGADFGEAGDSAVDVPFRGSSLGVTIRRGAYRAYLYAAVDGAPPADLPQDERGAYLVLTSPNGQPIVETLPVVTGLAEGARHVAHLEAERGWDQWALAGFAVGANVKTWPYDALTAALIALAAGLIVAAFRMGRGQRWRASMGRVGGRIASGLGDAAHFALSLGSALAVWIGAALTWGGLIPNLTRRLGEGPSLAITALTAGVFYFSPWLVLTLIALAALFVLIYARPGVGLALIMFFTPYVMLPRPLFDRAFSMVEVTSLLTLAAWAIRVAAGRGERGWPTLRELWRAMTPLDRAVGLFALTGVAALAWSDLKGVALTDLRQMVLEPLIVYLVLRTLPLTRRERWRIVDLLMATGALVALIGFYQFATGIDVITAEAGARRLKSVFGTPNNAALYFGRLVPIGAAVAVMGEGRRRWAYGAAAALMAVALGLTLSKGAILLALPAGLGMVLVLWLGRAGLIAVGAGVAAEALALIPLSRHPRFSGLVDFTSPTSTSRFRLELWQSTLRLLRDHPITGVGLDQFLYAYRGRYILPAAWRQPDLSQPHNFLLNYWVRMGIVGLAAGVWMQVAFWRLAWRTQDALRGVDRGGRALAVGLMGGMAAMIAHGMVDAVHFVIDLAFIFSMSLGLMAQLGEEAAGYGRGDDRRADAVAGRG